VDCRVILLDNLIYLLGIGILNVFIHDSRVNNIIIFIIGKVGKNWLCP